MNEVGSSDVLKQLFVCSVQLWVLPSTFFCSDGASLRYPMLWGIEGNHLGYAWRYHYGFVGPDPLLGVWNGLDSKSRISQKLVGLEGQWDMVFVYLWVILPYKIILGDFYIDGLQILWLVSILQLNWMMTKDSPIPAVLQWLTPRGFPIRESWGHNGAGKSTTMSIMTGSRWNVGCVSWFFCCRCSKNFRDPSFFCCF